MRGYATHRALARRLSLSAFAAVVSVGSAVPAFGAEDQTVIEEIVVTGSLIRRDSFDSPSPLTVARPPTTVAVPMAKRAVRSKGATTVLETAPATPPAAPAPCACRPKACSMHACSM